MRRSARSRVLPPWHEIVCHGFTCSTPSQGAASTIISNISSLGTKPPLISIDNADVRHTTITASVVRSYLLFRMLRPSTPIPATVGPSQSMYFSRPVSDYFCSLHSPPCFGRLGKVKRENKEEEAVEFSVCRLGVEDARSLLNRKRLWPHMPASCSPSSLTSYQRGNRLVELLNFLRVRGSSGPRPSPWPLGLRHLHRLWQRRRLGRQ